MRDPLYISGVSNLMLLLGALRGPMHHVGTLCPLLLPATCFLYLAHLVTWFV